MKNQNKVHISGELPFRFVAEGQWLVSRCEILGVSSQGKTENSARCHLRAAILLFFQECLETDTLVEVLMESGFSVLNVGKSSLWLVNNAEYATRKYRPIKINGVVRLSREPSIKTPPTFQLRQTEFPFWVETEPHAPATAT